MGRKFHHLTYSDRLKIEALHMAKHTSQEIADQLGVHVSTINSTRSIASTSKIKSRLTAALVINSFESRPADLVTTVTDHPERTGRYHPYVSESLLRDIRSNHTVLGCLPLLFPQCCR